MSGTYVRGDERYLSGTRDAQLTQNTPQAAWALWLMLAVVVTALAWAALARVDEVSKAEGKVVADGRDQNIASLEGGILAALLVREGDLVEAGQDLAQLDPTRFEAQQAEGRAKQIALRAAVARLSAEAYARPLRFPPEVAAEADVLRAETDAYHARAHALEEAVATSRASIALLRRELGMAQRLSAQGLMSEVEVMRLRRQINELTMQMQERVNRFRQDASTELVRAQTDLAQLDEQQVVRQDALRRTVLKSPVRGVVKTIKIGTLGGVVGPGAVIMEISPMGPRVLVEAHVKPSDIGFVRVGLPAEVKLYAYDYFTYGGLKGTIDYLSPDALPEEGRPASGEATYYRALIRADASGLKAGGKPLTVIPGMTASVEVRTGERTVLDYLLKPVLKSREAFRER